MDKYLKPPFAKPPFRLSQRTVAVKNGFQIRLVLISAAMILGGTTHIEL